ncbi:MAG: AarF/ABC1/UbiB kinase family protein [Deltaproteobacteria bacterium]
MKRLKRLGAITSVLAKHGFGNLISRLFNPKGKRQKTTEGRPSDRELLSTPRRLRLALEELGPSFIKLGQLLSTRADILPPAYIDELRKLQDQVAPVAFAKIKQVIEHELKRPLTEIFSEFDKEPTAAASIAQVHIARLFSGARVAVKIVRPDIATKIRNDISLMYYFAAKAEKIFPAARSIGAVNLVKEFERTVFRELDMFIEAGNLEKFKSAFRDTAEIHIPAVFWDMVTKSVLVMEYIDGIKMDQVEELRAHDIDPKEVALIGLRSFSRQLMEFGFFHADPHPANTLVMLDGRVSLIDFGITGYLEQQTMHQIARIFLGYAEHDYDMVMGALWDMGLLEEDSIDLKEFRQDLKDVSEPFYGRSLRTISVKDVYDQVMGLVLRHGIRLPRNLLLLLKTFIQTEALGKILGSDASLLEVTRPYARKLLHKGQEADTLLRHLHEDATLIGGYLKMLPKFAHDILQQTARGKQRVEIHHTGFEELADKVEKGANRVILGLLVAASLVAASLILNSGQQLLNFTFSLADGRTLSLAALLGLAGYGMATLLGIWLVVSILRSGKL